VLFAIKGSKNIVHQRVMADNAAAGFEFHAFDATTVVAPLSAACRAGSVEETDFLRFRTIGRSRQLLLYIAVSAVYHLIVAATLPPSWVSAANGAAAVVLLPVIVAALVLVECRGASTRAEQVNKASWHERCGVFAVLTTGCVLCVTAYPGTTEFCASRIPANDTRGIGRCHAAALDAAAVVFGVITFIVKPRLSYLAAAIACSGLSFIAGAVVVRERLDTIDFVVIVVVVVAFGAVCGMESLRGEQLERKGFAEVAKLRRAVDEVDRLKADAAHILLAALPPELLDDACNIRVSSHRAVTATVAVTDIFDFAHWSCGLLVGDTVSVLHALLSLCDLGAAQFGVVRAMTFGDSCVVCSGLLSPCVDHRGRVAAFAEWYVENGPVAATTVGAPGAGACEFRVRACVSTGGLVGGVAGMSSLRYVVAGPAMDAAAAGLRAAAPHAAVVLDDASVLTSVPESDDSANEALAGMFVDDSRTSDSTSFSRLSLTFANDQQAVFYRFAADDGAGRFTPVFPAAVFGAFLVAVLVELFGTRDRHPSGWTLGGLTAAVVAAAANYAMQRAEVAVPFLVHDCLTAVSLLLGSWALAVATAHSHYGAPSSGLMCVLMFPAMFPRSRWVVQCGAQIVCVFAAVVFDTATRFDNPENDQGLTLPGLFLTLLLFVSIRYVHSLTLCERFAVSQAAAAALLLESRRLVLQDLLLIGMVPLHAVGYATPSNTVELPQYVELWRDLTVLQVAMRLPAAPTSFSDVRDPWLVFSAVLQPVGDESALLQLVQSSGDSLLIAGPFTQGRDDARRHSAALVAVRLLRALAARIAGEYSLTAILTGGSAFGALLGAAQLTFRLCGAVIRESDALLAAAPCPHDRLQCAAFASAAYRRQHANHVPAAVLQGVKDAALSAAVAEDASRDVASSIGDDDDFYTPTMWRVRGVGAMFVAAVKLLIPGTVAQ
jgi:hypothetical protein